MTMEHAPEFETPEMPFEDLRNDIETSQAQLADFKNKIVGKVQEWWVLKQRF